MNKGVLSKQPGCSCRIPPSSKSGTDPIFNCGRYSNINLDFVWRLALKAWGSILRGAGCRFGVSARGHAAPAALKRITECWLAGNRSRASRQLRAGTYCAAWTSGGRDPNAVRSTLAGSSSRSRATGSGWSARRLKREGISSTRDANSKNSARISAFVGAYRP
jgi:hypothetical protein